MKRQLWVLESKMWRKPGWYYCCTLDASSRKEAEQLASHWSTEQSGVFYRAVLFVRAKRGRK